MEDLEGAGLLPASFIGQSDSRVPMGWVYSPKFRIGKPEEANVCHTRPSLVKLLARWASPKFRIGKPEEANVCHTRPSLVKLLARWASVGRRCIESAVEAGGVIDINGRQSWGEG